MKTVILKRAAVLALVVALAGCAQTFKTSYDTPVDASVAAGWRVTSVKVDVPETLTVSDADTLVPNADIVWHGDPAGDRRAQVAAIVKQGIVEGAAPLHGRRAVGILATLQKFHALSPSAEAVKMDGVGVHDIIFSIEVVDQKTGAILMPPQVMDASLPGLTGARAVEQAKIGNTQKRQITAHIRATIAGWLGVGPDVRNTFQRIGD